MPLSHETAPQADPGGLCLSCRFDWRIATTQFKRAIDMTDDELAAIVAKAKLTVVT